MRMDTYVRSLPEQMNETAKEAENTLKWMSKNLARLDRWGEALEEMKLAGVIEKLKAVLIEQLGSGITVESVGELLDKIDLTVIAKSLKDRNYVELVAILADMLPSTQEWDPYRSKLGDIAGLLMGLSSEEEE